MRDSPVLTPTLKAVADDRAGRDPLYLSTETFPTTSPPRVSIR